MGTRKIWQFVRWIVLAGVLLSSIADRGGTPPGVRAAASAEPASLRFDQASYQQQGCAGLTLRDPARNRDAAKRESLNARVRSRSAGDLENVALLESAADSGEFVLPQCLPLSSLPASPDDEALQVVSGDILIGLMLGPDNKALQQLDTALVAGGKPRGDFAPTIDPSILPQAMRSTPSMPGEPDFPLALAIDPSGAPAFFGEDHVIYRPATPQDLDSFLARRGGRVLTTINIPTGEQGQEAGFYLIRVDPSAFDASDFAYRMEQLGVKGQYTYSSENAVRLMAMLVEEQLAGSMVLPSALMQYQAAPVGDEGPGNDWFRQPWYNPTDGVQSRVGARQALTLAEIADLRSAPQVPVAFIDGGFASPADYPSRLDNPDFGTADARLGITPARFNDLAQCSIDAFGGADCRPGAAAGPNPLPCSGAGACPWHGTLMVSVAGAEFNNSFGAAGSGAPAVAPMLFKVGLPYIGPTAAAISRATSMGARVINISSGFPCRALVLDACDTAENLALTAAGIALCSLLAGIPEAVGIPCATLFLLLTIPPQAGAMQAAVAAAERANVVIAAAAGNSVSIAGISAGPFDADSVRLIPCVLANVVCVGGLASGADLVDDSAVSGFGRSVDIWAPGRFLTATPDPDSGGGLRMNVRGTSPATAFVSGALALIRAINPSLSAAQTRAVLLAARCHPGNTARTGLPACIPSGSARVNIGSAGPGGSGGYIDMLETVKRAGLPAELAACDGGWDELSTSDDTPLAAGVRTLSPATPLRFAGNLSIHALPGDEDWFGFQLPASSVGGASSANLTIELSFASASGALAMEIYRSPGGTSNRVAAPIARDGRASFSGLFLTNTPYLVRIFAASPATRNDTCYSNTLIIRYNSAGPALDDLELNESLASASRLDLADWTHRHDTAAGLESQEVWTMRLENLSLHNASDRDFFRVAIPDPASAADGGHADLLECGRRPASGHLEYLMSGTLSVRVIPQGSAPGEAIWLYRDGARDSRLGSGPALHQQIACPRSGHELRELLFSFGERATGPRGLSARYTLELEYRVVSTLGPSEWLRDTLNSARMVCPGGLFPYCDPSIGDPASGRMRFELGHPFILPDLCLADGCPELLYFMWPGGDFEAAFGSEAALNFRLLDDRGAQIAAVQPALQGATMAEAIEQSIRAPQLAPGLYVLEVSGPEALYSVEFAPVGGKTVYVPVVMAGKEDA